MTVTKIWTPSFTEPMEKSALLSDSFNDPTLSAVIRIGNLCNNARLSSLGTAAATTSIGMTGDNGPNSRFVGQATDVALLDLMDAFEEVDVRERSQRVSESPFSSENKWMGVIVGGGDIGGQKAYIKGALEQVLARCNTYLTKDGREAPMDDAQKKLAKENAEIMAKEGLRVLGFASGSVSSRPNSGTSHTSLEGDNDSAYTGLTFAGTVGMNDPPRQGVKKAIRSLMRGGVKVIMITGDSETTAVAIARKLGMHVLPDNHGPGGIVRPVLKGEDLDNMTDSQLAQAIATTSIFARTSPEHKMKIIRALQSRGDVVAMTGDGVNDAPALKMADIGISMGLQGTDVAKEAADMILSNDDFSTILTAIEEGKGIFYNIQNFLTFQLSTSIAALSLVLLCTFFGLSNPLNPMQILWISMLHFLQYLQLHVRIFTNFYLNRHLDGRSSRTISRR
jgi:Ca2+-transporting ATPase